MGDGWKESECANGLSLSLVAILNCATTHAIILNVCYLRKELKFFHFVMFAITQKLWVVSKSLHSKLVGLFTHCQFHHGEFKGTSRKGL